MDIYNINKFPIVIIANSRTGSTALANKIAKIYNITNFSDGAYIEPHKHKRHVKQLWKDFVLHNNKKIVVKMIAYQIGQAYMYEQILNADSFKIKLLRRNKVDEITSAYIAKERGLYHQKKDDVIDNSDIPINEERIALAIDRVMKVEKIIDELDYVFDLELYYEDLTFDDYDISDVKSTVPKNINDIKEAVRNMLQIGNNNV